MMPHLAEECWAALGHAGLVVAEPWPEHDPALLVADTITLPVQVNGKKRDEIVVARDAGAAEIEAIVLKLEEASPARSARSRCERWSSCRSGSSTWWGEFFFALLFPSPLAGEGAFRVSGRRERGPLSRG